MKVHKVVTICSCMYQHTCSAASAAPSEIPQAGSL